MSSSRNASTLGHSLPPPSQFSVQSQGSAKQGTGTAFYQSSLERKLELLEARFSQPLGQQSPAGASEATMQPLSSPNWPRYGGGGATAYNNSQQSFGFDSPTTTDTAVVATKIHSSHETKDPEAQTHSRARGGDSNPFVLSTRSKRDTSPVITSTLDQVRQATERHMLKVAATQRFVVNSSSCSDVSSESTRLVQNCALEGPSTPPALALAALEQTHIQRKRKSVPVKKVEEPSVKEILRTVDRNGANRNRTGQARSHAQRKLVDGSSKAEENVREPSGANNEDPTNVTPVALTVDTTATSRPSNNASNNNNNNTTPKSSLSPRPNKAARSQRSTQNNASITDFFHNAPSKRRKTSNPDSAETVVDPIQPQQLSDASFACSKPEVNTVMDDAQLQKRVEELERTCRDQEEQLKAVTNNRTILHTALQSALDQRQKELVQLRTQKDAWESRSRHVLEEFVRAEASRTARQVRERLASDGARLGRIVYSRAGIRSAAVETWEEGHAVRNLITRQATVREKRKSLEERYSVAQKEAEPWLSTSTIASKTPEASTIDQRSSHDNMEKVGAMPILSKMDALEAVESVRYHLENMRKKERELLEEEKALNDEKSLHIRALKRVASEDASRFRSCPKLNDRFVLQSLLGKGGFSEVWRAFDLVDLREVAVKIHQLDPRWSEAKKENYTKHVSREYEIHRNVRHPRIVSLLDVFEIDNNSFATVLELCEGTDLDALLKEKRRLPERDARAILLQILSGMQYLSHPSADGNRQGIIHYDLKPGNILFDEFGDAKITDFGLSKIVDNDDPAESMELTSQGAGTYWYLPPECFVMDAMVRISNKVDVWSIGVIFYQMLFGRRPFGDGQSQDGILTNQTMLNARQVVFPDKPAVSEECKAFIRKCLSYDQAYRPSIAQLCQQPYVTNKGS